MADLDDIVGDPIIAVSDNVIGLGFDPNTMNADNAWPGTYLLRPHPRVMTTWDDTMDVTDCNIWVPEGEVGNNLWSFLSEQELCDGTFATPLQNQDPHHNVVYKFGTDCRIFMNAYIEAFDPVGVDVLWASGSNTCRLEFSMRPSGGAWTTWWELCRTTQTTTFASRAASYWSTNTPKWVYTTASAAFDVRWRMMYYHHSGITSTGLSFTAGDIFAHGFPVDSAGTG